MKDKEEFSRGDPGKSRKIYWLVIINWTVPILCVIGGLFLSTQKFADMMNYDYRVIGYPLFVTQKGYRIYNPLYFFLGVFKYAFNNTYSYYFFQAAPPTFYGIVAAALTYFFLNLFTSFQKNQHIHGTARWASTKDLIKFGMLQHYGVVCGELNSAYVTYEIGGEKKDKLILHLKKSFFRKIFNIPPKAAPLVCHSGSTNTWMIAPTRSGKGVSVIMPTCLNYGVPYYVWSYNKKSIFYKYFDGKLKFLARKGKVIAGKASLIVFDPKGENYECSAGFRYKFSTILPFNPMQIDDSKGNPIGTVHYNPIIEIPDTRKDAFAWSDMFGEFFFSEGGEGDNAFFYNNARDIFTACIMHVRFAKNIPPMEKTFTKVLELFSMAEEESDEQQGGDEGGNSPLLKYLKSEEHIHDDGTSFPEIHHLIELAANRSAIMTPKERASVFSTVFSELTNFQDPLIEECTRYSDFSVHDFMESVNGISLYLIIPYNHIKRISPLFRLLINFIIRNFSDGATNANSQKLSIPCMFLLDEFPVLGKFPEIEQNAGVLAGYGVTFLIVSQSLSQIVNLYTEHHAFLDHCKTIILYAPGKYSDAKEFAETMGNRSVLLDNVSSSGSKREGGFSNISRSSQETATSLINPDELMKLEFNRAIIMNQGMPPYKAKKVVYYEDPRFKDIQFLPIPDMDTLMKRVKKLPSNLHPKLTDFSQLKKNENMNENVERIVNKIKKDESINVSSFITSDFDVFDNETSA